MPLGDNAPMAERGEAWPCRRARPAEEAYDPAELVLLQHTANVAVLMHGSGKERVAREALAEDAAGSPAVDWWAVGRGAEEELSAEGVRANENRARVRCLGRK